MGGFSRRQKEAVKRAQGGICAFCQEELGDDFQVHDIFGLEPIGMGHMTIHQALALCPECHEMTINYKGRNIGGKGIFNHYAGFDKFREHLQEYSSGEFP